MNITFERGILLILLGYLLLMAFATYADKYLETPISRLCGSPSEHWCDAGNS